MSPQIAQFIKNHGEFKVSTVKNLFIVLGSIIQGKTVNLYNLKDEVGKISEKYKSQPNSHYRRLTRFFAKNSLNLLWLSILNFGLYLVGNTSNVCYLDATEWSIGKFKLHCLMLVVDYHGVPIPMYFKLYNHKGVLSEKERIDFIKMAHQWRDLSNKILIADREFIGNHWFTSFEELSIHFIIRIRKGLYKNSLIGNKTYDKLEKRAFKKSKASCLVNIEGQTFRLWIVKNEDSKKDEPLIYILTSILEKRDTPAHYRLRWKIECFFKHLKTNGYHLEDLRMTDLNKIRLLIAVVSLAYILAALTALDERKKKSMPKKYYKNGDTFDAVSVFKQGQAILKQSFITLKRLLEIIQFLNVTIKSPIPVWRENVQ